MIIRKCCNCRTNVPLTAGDFYTSYDPKTKDYMSYFHCPACQKRSLEIRMFDKKRRTQADFGLNAYQIAINETERLLKTEELSEDIKSSLRLYLQELETERRDYVENSRQ